jgi:hypothetical protein
VEEFFYFIARADTSVCPYGYTAYLGFSKKMESKACEVLKTGVYKA